MRTGTAAFGRVAAQGTGLLTVRGPSGPPAAAGGQKHGPAVRPAPFDAGSRREGGFTLIELLIVVAIIGIISALLVPNLMTGLQNANQTRTQADMKAVGSAWMQWLTDQVSAAAAGSSTTATFSWSEYTHSDFSHADLSALLRPSNTFFYLQDVPERDGWNNPYRFGFAGSDQLLSTQVIGIWSGGRDGSNTAQPQSTYEIGAFRGTDFNEDLVWADGYWVRWPGSAAEAGDDSAGD